MSSTRLPGKVMADVVGAPMIARQIERVRRSARIDRIVLATSTDPTDDPLMERPIIANHPSVPVLTFVSYRNGHVYGRRDQRDAATI